MVFILARKLKMTSVFNENGSVVPVTVLEAGPCMVTQVRDRKKDGYNAVQIGYDAKKRVKKTKKGHLKDLFSYRYLQEFHVKNLSKFKRGDAIKVGTFKTGDIVNVSGTSKGHGFSGVIKKHKFSKGPESHGSRHHREPGSIGSMFPQHVVKGRKLPGHLGNARITTRNLEVIDVDDENNILTIKGAAPGHYGSIIRVTLVSREDGEKRKEENL